jgi:hypothetical protein
MIRTWSYVLIAWAALSPGTSSAQPLARKIEIATKTYKIEVERSHRRDDEVLVRGLVTSGKADAMPALDELARRRFHVRRAGRPPAGYPLLVLVKEAERRARAGTPFDIEQVLDDLAARTRQGTTPPPAAATTKPKPPSRPNPFGGK